MDSNLENVSNEIINASTTPPVQVSAKPKKSKGLIAAVIIFAILAVAGIAGAIYFFMDASSKAASNSELQAKLDLIQTETGAELVEKEENGTTITTVEVVDNSDDKEVKKVITDIYTTLIENISGVSFQRVFGDGSMIKLSGSNIYTASEKSYGIVSNIPTDLDAQTAVLNSAYEDAKTILMNNGFNEEKEVYLNDHLFYNSSNDIYCITAASMPFYLNCSKSSWISKEKQELVQQLANVANVEYINAFPSNIQDSPVSPYQTLTASGLGYGALFYRTSPDADWQFFTSGQVGPSCSKFNTQDLKNAFAGMTCIDDSTFETITIQP